MLSTFIRQSRAAISQILPVDWHICLYLMSLYL